MGNLFVANGVKNCKNNCLKHDTQVGGAVNFTIQSSKLVQKTVRCNVKSCRINEISH